MDKTYYVYQHIDLSNNEIFYIGMACHESGRGALANNFARAYDFRKKERSPYWWERFRKCNKGIAIGIVNSCLNIQTAQELETELISLHGRRINGSGSLVNIGNGGSHTVLGKRVFRYTKEGWLDKVYDNIGEAVLDSDITDKSIYKSASCPFPSLGKSWMWKLESSDGVVEKIPSYYDRRAKKIYAIKDGKRILFNSIMSASKELGVDTSCIIKCIAGSRISSGGYTFKSASNRE